MKHLLIAVTTAFVFALTAFTALGQKSFPSPIIKGVSLGMPLEKACKAFEKSTGQVREKKHGNLTWGAFYPDLFSSENTKSFCMFYSSGRFYAGYISAGEDGMVHTLYISAFSANEIFNTPDLSGFDFQKMFIKAYKLPMMRSTTFSRHRGYAASGRWWRDKSGWAFFIGDDKSIFFFKTKPIGARKFN